MISQVFDTHSLDNTESESDNSVASNVMSVEFHVIESLEEAEDGILREEQVEKEDTWNE